MLQLPVYMDDHATTRVDPRVLEVMLPFFTEQYGNAGSVNHSFGWDADKAVTSAREYVAHCFGASAKEILFTSGATESNNLAIRGACLRNQASGNHVISVVTEHHAVLDPIDRLARQDGFDVTLLPVCTDDPATVGVVNLDQLEECIKPTTILVSVMLANNEIGVIQPIQQIGELCRRHNVLLHTDATQAVGRVPINVEELHIDLMSFSAHKFYGPKGSGGLYVRRTRPAVKLQPLVDGGGQERGLRSGTLNPAAIVGMHHALAYAIEDLSRENSRLARLRNELFQQLTAGIADVQLNGPGLQQPQHRLANNLNVCFGDVDGEALMMSTPDLAVSSGSACSSTNPEPSHVLRAIGLSDDQTRASLRFGLGRFSTAEHIQFAVDKLSESVKRLRALKRI
ncbi:MAG: cysteine desulfurase family protein [Planctomycetota bacterium]|nr:cysteine desulfurase family protein [Planctomycetota bacterium]